MDTFLSMHFHNYNIGSGALSGKMLLARIIENNKIDDYFRSDYVNQRLALPRIWLGKD